jgi:nicotinate-nucleotide adenylyltransferase
MARAALDALALDRLLWLPTGRPKYRQPPVASPKHRIAMLRLATDGEKRYAIEERELADSATGYTVDTLRELKAGSDDLYLIMGADQYSKLGSWHRPEEVQRLARLAVFARPGFALREKDVSLVPMEPLAISASDIRSRVARGEDIGALVPPAVANYIRREGLYT